MEWSTFVVKAESWRKRGSSYAGEYPYIDDESGFWKLQMKDANLRRNVKDEASKTTRLNVSDWIRGLGLG
jgi:hypothetical protein